MLWPMMEALALILLGGGALLFWLAFRRASRRTRRELAELRREHRRALEQVAGDDPRWSFVDGEPSAEWAALTVARRDLDMRLFAAADLGKTTFIRYRTRLHVRPRQGRFVTPPGGLDLTFGEPGVVPAVLARVGPNPKTAVALSELAGSMRLDSDCLELVARPGGAPV